MKIFCSVLAVGLILLTGCASYAKRLEVSTVSKVSPSRTTRAQAEKLLGHPQETVLGANGVTVARYFFHEFQPSTDASLHERRRHPGDILFRTLTLRYGSANVIEQKLHDESVTPVYQTNAWYFAGPALSAEAVAFILRNVTTETEVVEKLGEPSARTFDGEGRRVFVWFSVKTRETSWSDPDVQKLMMLLDERRVVRDYVLVEFALSEFEPLTLH